MDILTIVGSIFAVYIGIQVLIGALGVAGGIIELAAAILCDIVYSMVLLVRYLIRITTGKDIMGSFNRRIKRRSDQLGVDRPDSFHQAQRVISRSEARSKASKNRPSNLSPKFRGTWDAFVDIFREKKEKK